MFGKFHEREFTWKDDLIEFKSNFELSHDVLGNGISDKDEIDFKQTLFTLRS